MAAKVPLLCRGHSRPVVDLSFSNITDDGFFLISSCLDGKPMLRYGPTGDWVGTFIGHKGAVWCSRLNSTATQAVTGSADYTAKIWDALTGNELHSFVHNRVVKTVAFSNNDSKIATVGMERILRIFDLEKPGADPLESTPPNTKPSTMSKLYTMWLPSSENLVLLAGNDEYLRIVDTRTMTEVKQHKFPDVVTAVELSYDGSTLSCCYGQKISFLNSETLDEQKTLQIGTAARTTSLHKDKRYFISGGADDFWVRVFDFESGTQLDLNKAHHGPVHCVKFSPDGDLYASGSEDGTIRLWQTTTKEYYLWQKSSNVPDQSSQQQ